MNARYVLHYLLVMLLISFAFSLMALPRSIGASGGETTHESFSYTAVTVESGDSLWRVAAAHGPKDLETERVVTLIREANDLSSCVIQPGQTLMVPVQRTGK